MHPQKTAVHLVLFRLDVPVELRSIIIEDYFPFLPNPYRQGTSSFDCNFYLRWKINCSRWKEMKFGCYPNDKGEIDCAVTLNSFRFIGKLCDGKCKNKMEFLSQCSEFPSLKISSLSLMRIENMTKEEIKKLNIETDPRIKKWYTNTLLSIL